MSESTVPRSEGDLHIKQGSTFWDWLTGSHPVIRRLAVAAVVLVVIIMLYRWNSAYVFILLAAFLAGFIVFRSILISEGSVRVIALDPESPTRIDIRLVGSKKFSMMVRDQTPLPFCTSEGLPVYVAEKMDVENNSMVFAWIHQTSRWRFMTQSEAYEQLREIAEVNTRELMLIRHIPRTLAMKEAGRIIRRYDESIEGILTGRVTVEDLESEITEGRDILEEMEAAE